MEVKEREKPLVKDLNEHIVCPLCRGYLIDATTLVECLHSFCRGCIVRRLSSGVRACPVCNIMTSPPLIPDTCLQRLVYLTVPGLFRSELERRRYFRLVNPQCPPLIPPLGALALTLDDFVSLSLQELEESENEARERGVPTGRDDISTCRPEEYDGELTDLESEKSKDSASQGGSMRYLKCPAAVTIRHLIRLLMLKRGWEETTATIQGVNRIEIIYQQNNLEHGNKDNKMQPLDTSWTLLDLACIFQWKGDAPMKLFYRVLRKETSSVTKDFSFKDDVAKYGFSMIENIQRPPTPPPSPKPSREPEAEACLTSEGNAERPRVLETNVDRDKETKIKKPRCEVTPVMRTLDPPAGSSVNNHQSLAQSIANTKSNDIPRLEHRKRRKRRNKRVIAEITTMPREDLLKLKVRLTPCPPRITSSGSSDGSGQKKEKLLQMRALRRDKNKGIGQQQQQQRSATTNHEETDLNECLIEAEETIEDIIDSIPDEVVRIAQTICGKNDDTAAELITEKEEPESQVKPPEKSDEPKKDEEILRRLGLVAINEASCDSSLRDKAKPCAQDSMDKEDSLDREKLEKQLRESKANRVRSLLAEKQMRDALKSIMSKTKEECISIVGTSTPSSASAPKKKGPPPLAPLRVVKPSGFAASNNVSASNAISKYETPLDLSSGGTTNDNALDLSAALHTVNSSSSSSSYSSSPSFSSCSISSLPSSKLARPAISAGPMFRKSKELDQQRRGQESNLKTLSDAAVSLLSGCLTEKTPAEPISLVPANMAAAASGKVALRIPQPHQRISGFGMKIKPNLSIRHIPNPQAVVASQYRNQRASYFNSVSQQPP